MSGLSCHRRHRGQRGSHANLQSFSSNAHGYLIQWVKCEQAVLPRVTGNPQAPRCHPKALLVDRNRRDCMSRPHPALPAWALSGLDRTIARAATLMSEMQAWYRGSPTHPVGSQGALVSSSIHSKGTPAVPCVRSRLGTPRAEGNRPWPSKPWTLGAGGCPSSWLLSHMTVPGSAPPPGHHRHTL